MKKEHRPKIEQQPAERLDELLDRIASVLARYWIRHQRSQNCQETEVDKNHRGDEKTPG